MPGGHDWREREGAAKPVGERSGGLRLGVTSGKREPLVCGELLRELAEHAPPHGGGKHRHEDEREDQRGGKRDDDGPGEVAKNLAGDTLDESHGGEDGDGGHGGGEDGCAHLFGASDGGGSGAVAERLSSGDGLEHDDGVVDDHAGAEREAAERHDVEADAEHLHAGEGNQRGDGNRESDGDGGEAGAEEEEDNDDGPEGAHDRRIGDLLDGGAYKDGLVADDAEFDAGRCLVLQRGRAVGVAAAVGRFLLDAGQVAKEALMDGVGDGDEVGVAIFEDRDLDRSGAVETGDDLDGPELAGDGGDVADADGRGACAEREVGKLGGRGDLVDGADEVVDAFVAELAAGYVDGLAAERCLDLADLHAGGAEPVAVEGDADEFVAAAAGADGGDAGHALELRLDELLGVPGKLGGRLVAGDGDPQDGVERGVVAEERGLARSAVEFEDIEALTDPL